MRPAPAPRPPRHAANARNLAVRMETAVPSGAAIPKSLDATLTGAAKGAAAAADLTKDGQTDRAKETAKEGADQQGATAGAASADASAKDGDKAAKKVETKEDGAADANTAAADATSDTAQAADAPPAAGAPGQASIAGGGELGAELEVPQLPKYLPPDLNAIRSPVVRPPPAKAIADTAEILKETGATPSDHHADIQAALFRVGQAARAAQRTMVAKVDSIAVGARWDIEAMAAQIDGIVEQACGIVSGAANAAYAEIEAVAEARIKDVLAKTQTASTDMAANETKVRQEVVDALKKSGSGEILAAHNALVAAYDTYMPQAAEKLPKMAEGKPPAPIKFGADSGEKLDAYSAAEGEVTTFDARGEKIVGELFTSPAGGSGGSQFYDAFIGRAQAGAVPYLATEHKNSWVTGANKRAEQLKSADNKNRFVLTALGLVAPTAKAMDVDEKKYQKTLSDEVYRQYGKMSAAQERAISGMESTLRGPNSVKAFFNPANPKSMPAGVIKGLRKTGKKMKQAMLDQARLQQAGYRAGVHEMAKAYPDVVARLEEMLDGDDMLDARKLSPRIAAAADSLQKLQEGHEAATQAQADAGVRQAREGFQTQIGSIWDTVDGALSKITEQKEKSKFHFELTYGFYSGELTDGLKGALKKVSGYAETAAKALLAPIDAAEKAGTRVQQRAIAHFNGQLAGEWKGYIQNAVNKLDDAIGHGSGKDADGKKPLPTIARDKKGELNTRGADIMAALKEPNTTGIVIGLGVAYLTPPPISWAGAAYAGYEMYSAIPSKSGAAKALAMPWPGPLALNHDMETRGRTPNAQERVQRFMPDGDKDKPRLLGLFSPNEGNAAEAKQQLIADADRMWGINDEAVQAMAKSFSPSELSTLSPEQKAQMQASVKSNLSGVDLQVTQAYIDGNPARAAAVRIRDDLDRARRGGDAAMAEFTRTMDSRLKAELQSSGGAYVPKEQLAQLTDQMYVEMTALIPPKPGAGRSIQTAQGGQAAASSASQTAAAQTASQTATPAQAAAKAPRLPNPANKPAANTSNAVPRSTDLPALDLSGDADPAQATQSLPQDDAAAARFQKDAVARARQRPDADTVAAARQQFADFATRDYVSAQYYGALSPLVQGQGDGRIMQWLAPGADADQLRQMPGYQVSGSRSVHGNIIVDAMSDSTTNLLNAYITKGSESPEYKQARAVQALAQPGTRTFGASEADIVEISQAFKSPALSMAKSRLAEAEKKQPPDPAAVADAQAAVDREQRTHDLFLYRVAAQMGGQTATANPRPEDIAAARAMVAGRINEIAGGFNDELATMGNDLTANGAMDLGAGLRAATQGWGTHDALLNEAVSNRRRHEFQTYFGDQGKKDGISRESLGVGQNADWFAETSGDQAQSLEIAMLGVPENSADEMDIAGVKARHQLQDGTGFIAAITMSGSPLTGELQQAQAALGNRVHSSIAQNNDPHNPVPPDVLAMSPAQLVNPDGTLTAVARKYCVDRHGNFFGSGPSSADLSAEVDNAARNYSAEIARQESFFTGMITAAAVAVSVLLLLVPGVNVAAAGVLTALIAGSATIAVKAGMRGDRYGWEEAAVDVARTGIEAATAGVGGALGGAVKPGAGVLGKIASVGDKINKAFPPGLMGRAGAAATREAITSAASGVANQALDDKIWTKGIGNGLSKLAGAGLRGAATGAVSGGVSEGLTSGVKGAMGASRVSNVDGDGLNWLGKRLGGTGREIVEDALSGMGATAASELTGFLADVAQDKPGMKFDNFLKALGPAMLKDLASSTGRGMAKGHMRQRLQQETARVMAKGEVSISDAVMLRRLAISAGVETYGAGRVKDKLAAGYKADATANAMYLGQLRQAKQALSEMPQNLAQQMRHMSPGDILMVQSLRRGGGTDDPQAIEGLALSLRNNYDLNSPAAFFQTLRAVVADDTRAAQADTSTRKRLMRDVSKEARNALDGAPVDAITALPRVLQDEAARLLADPGTDTGALGALVAKAKARRPDTDTEALTAQMQALMGGALQAGAKAKDARARQQAELEPLLPRGLREVADALPQKDLAFLHRVAMAPDGLPPPKQLDGLMRMLAKRAPHLNDEVRGALVGTMLQNGKAARAKADAQEQASRMAQLDTAPPEARKALAALPPDAILALRRAQQLGPPLGDADLRALIAQARRKTPNLEPKALLSAMKAMQAARPPARPFFERFRQRRALISFVPKALRGLVKRTPILTLSDAAFAAYVRANPDATDRQNAVTIRLNGEVVILVREGADPFALREEGAHVVQMHDPAWAPRLAQLDEATLNDWPSLPAADQARLAKIVVDAEIDAHHSMIASLRKTAAGAFLPGARDRALTRLEALETRLAGLHRRKSELDGLHPSILRAIEAGHIPRPDLLAQPARLFNEDADTTPPKTYSEDDLARLEGTAPDEVMSFDQIKTRLEGLNTENGEQNLTLERLKTLTEAVTDAELPAEVTTGLRYFLGTLLDQDNAGLAEGMQSSDAKADRLGYFLKQIEAHDLLPKIKAALSDPGDTAGPHRASIIGQLLTQLGHDFFYPKYRFRKGEMSGLKRQALGSGKTPGQMIAAVALMVTRIGDIDAAHVAAMRGPIAEFVHTSTEMRGQIRRTQGHSALRNKLARFVRDVHDKTKNKTLLDDPPRRVEKMQNNHLGLVDPNSLKSVDAELGRPELLRAMPELSALVTQFRLETDARDIALVKPLDEAGFAGLMTEAAGKGGITGTQAKALFPIFQKITTDFALGEGTRITQADQIDAVLRAVYHAHRLMHGQSSGKNLSPQAVLRLLDSGRFVQFRTDAERAALPKQHSADGKIGLPKLPLRSLQALAHMDQLLSAQPKKKGAWKGQIKNLVDALETSEKVHPNRTAEVLLPKAGRAVSADEGSALPEKIRLLIYEKLLAASGHLPTRADMPNLNPTMRDAALTPRADNGVNDVLELADQNKTKGNRAEFEKDILDPKKRAKMAKSNEDDDDAPPQFDGTSTELADKHGDTDMLSIQNTLLQIAMGAIPFDLADTMARLAKAGIEDSETVEKAAFVALLSPLNIDVQEVVQIGPDAFFVRLTSMGDETFTGFVSNMLSMGRSQGKGQLNIKGGSAYPDITDVVVAMREADSSFNLFSFMKQAMRSETMPALDGGDPVLQHKVYNEMVLAAYLMFGVESIRDPIARTGAVLSLFLGSNMEVGADRTPSSLLLGNSKYKKEVLSFLSSLANNNARDVRMFEGGADQAAANSLMQLVVTAQQNRFEVKSGGLFPSTLQQYLSHAKLVQGAFDGSVDDPASQKFAQEIVNRYAKLFELAVDTVLRDELRQSETSAVDLISREIQGDQADAFVQKVMLQMMKDLFSEDPGATGGIG